MTLVEWIIGVWVGVNVLIFAVLAWCHRPDPTRVATIHRLPVRQRFPLT